MKRGIKEKAVAMTLGLFLVLGAVIIPSVAASAYSHNACSWAPYGSNVTWLNQSPGGDYYNSGTAAGYSWAANTDINGMSPNNGSLVGYTDNKGANGYDGLTSYGCNGNRMTYANATLNPYYMDSKSYSLKKAVWLHELGHALGMGHSGTNAIMYSCPACVGYTVPQSDDINGINARY